MITINGEKFNRWLEQEYSNLVVTGKKFNLLMKALEDNHSAFYINEQKINPDTPHWYYICYLIANPELYKVIIHAYDKDLYSYTRSHFSKKHNIEVIRDEYDATEYQYVIEFVDEEAEIKTMNTQLFKLIKSRYQVFYHKPVRKVREVENFNT